MITVTTFRDTELVINADLIESVEKTPDTIITLTTGKKLMVKQTVEEIVEAVVAYRQRVFMNLLERKS
jgi:flagellar protein FlbD